MPPVPLELCVSAVTTKEKDRTGVCVCVCVCMATVTSDSLHPTATESPGAHIAALGVCS